MALLKPLCQPALPLSSLSFMSLDLSPLSTFCRGSLELFTPLVWCYLALSFLRLSPFPFCFHSSPSHCCSQNSNHDVISRLLFLPLSYPSSLRSFCLLLSPSFLVFSLLFALHFLISCSLIYSLLSSSSLSSLLFAFPFTFKLSFSFLLLHFFLSSSPFLSLPHLSLLLLFSCTSFSSLLLDLCSDHRSVFFSSFLLTLCSSPLHPSLLSSSGLLLAFSPQTPALIILRGSFSLSLALDVVALFKPTPFILVFRDMPCPSLCNLFIHSLFLLSHNHSRSNVVLSLSFLVWPLFPQPPFFSLFASSSHPVSLLCHVVNFLFWNRAVPVIKRPNLRWRPILYLISKFDVTGQILLSFNQTLERLLTVEYSWGEKSNAAGENMSLYGRGELSTLIQAGWKWHNNCFVHWAVVAAWSGYCSLGFECPLMGKPSKDMKFEVNIC